MILNILVFIVGFSVGFGLPELVLWACRRVGRVVTGVNDVDR